MPLITAQHAAAPPPAPLAAPARQFGALQPRKGHKNEANELKIAVEKLVIPVTFAMQDQKVNNETVNAEQSLTLVRNLIRVTISQIAYIRNIFPSKCFEECQLF